MKYLFPILSGSLHLLTGLLTMGLCMAGIKKANGHLSDVVLWAEVGAVVLSAWVLCSAGQGVLTSLERIIRAREQGR
jgi:hypothetical protein